MEKVTKEYRDAIEKELTESMLAALDKELIKQDDMQVIATFILDRIDSITTREQLLQFLEDIASRWNFFSNLLTIEKGKQQAQVEAEVRDGVSLLLKHGKIDHAADLAKTVIQG